MTTQRTYLVTGGAGFIGSHLVKTLVQHGHRAIVLDALTYAGHASNLHHINPDHYQLVTGNITDGELISTLLTEHRCDGVLHLAAESHVDNSIDAPGAFIDTNILGTYALLNASLAYYQQLPETKQQHFRFLHVSTDEVYGSLELDSPDIFSETSPYQPSSPYSASKAASDHLAYAWHTTYGLPVIISHCSNNYGPRQYPEKLIPHMVLCALASKPLPLYGDGKNIRDWIHVQDHCHGLWLALTQGTPGHTYNFGGECERANVDIVGLICDTLDNLAPKAQGSYREQIAYVTDRLGHDRRYAVSNDKAQKTLGFTPSHHFETALKDTIAWYVQHQGWCQTMLEQSSAEAAA